MFLIKYALLLVFSSCQIKNILLDVDFATFKKKVGLRIKELRLARGLTQESLDTGDDGIPHRTVQNIEGGKSNPNLRTLHRLSKKFEIEPKDLLTIGDTKFRKKQKVTDEEFFSLYRYFLNADIMKKKFEETLSFLAVQETQERQFEAQAFIQLWYSFLYIVLEGATVELNIKDDPFKNLYDFEKEQWKERFIEKLKKYKTTFSKFHLDYGSSAYEEHYKLDHSLALMTTLHNVLAEYFKKEIKHRKSSNVLLKASK